jgi:hypothetical protein
MKQAANRPRPPFLLRQQVVEVEPKLGDRLLQLIVNPQIDEVVAQMRAHQEFSG